MSCRRLVVIMTLCHNWGDWRCFSELLLKQTVCVSVRAAQFHHQSSKWELPFSCLTSSQMGNIMMWHCQHKSLHKQLYYHTFSLQKLPDIHSASSVNSLHYCSGNSSYRELCELLRILQNTTNSTSLIQKTQEYWEIIGCENMQQYASNY